jgi:hypothetical protein
MLVIVIVRRFAKLLMIVAQGCIASNLPSLTTMWESIVYPQDEFSKWHRKDVSWVIVIYVEETIYPFVFLRKRGPQMPW